MPTTRPALPHTEERRRAPQPRSPRSVSRYCSPRWLEPSARPSPRLKPSDRDPGAGREPVTVTAVGPAGNRALVVDVPLAGNGSAQRGSFRLALYSLLVVELSSGVLQVYFVPLYPTLAARFGVGTGTVSWGLIAFTLPQAIFTPLFAKARRRLRSPPHPARPGRLRRGRMRADRRRPDLRGADPRAGAAGQVPCC
jgi:hypothetical protein